MVMGTDARVNLVCLVQIFLDDVNVGDVAVGGEYLAEVVVCVPGQLGDKQLGGL